MTMRNSDQVRPAAAFALVAIVTALGGCAPTPPAPAAAPTTEHAEVTAVVDGDTIAVDTAGGSARVRLIGIDTPEIGRDGEPGDCYAEEARDFLDALLYGKTVELVGDPTQADVDRYGRLLRHVLVDGQSAALAALTAGAGYEYTYDAPYADYQAHREAESAAEAAGAGLWATCSTAPSS